MLLLSLIKLFFCIITIVITGCGILLLFTPYKNNFSFPEKLAYSYGLGIGGITMMMLFMSLLKIPLNFKYLFPTIIVLNIVIFSIKKINFKKLLGFLKGEKSLKDTEEKNKFIFFGEIILIIFLLFLSLSSIFSAIFIPMQGWDAVAHWGLKSKIFYVNQAITFLDFDLHNEYPNLIPLAEIWVYIILGEINDRFVMILFPLFFISLIILFYFFQRRSGFSRIHSLVFTVFLVTGSNLLIFHSYIAYADLALTFFYSFGTLLFFFWTRNSEKIEYLTLSSVLVGMAIWTKSEALPMVLINFILLVTYLIQNKGKRNLKNFFIFLFIVSIFFIPWLTFCKLNRIDIGERYEFKLPDLEMVVNVFYYIKEFLLKDVIWVACILLSIFSMGKVLSLEKLEYLFYTVFLNLVFIIAIHLVSPSANLLISHIMDRLILHITPLAAFLVSSQVNGIIKSFDYNNLEEIVLKKGKN